MGGLEITAESAWRIFRRSFGRLQVCNRTSKSNIEVDGCWRVDVEDPDTEVKATHEGKKMGGLESTAE